MRFPVEKLILTTMTLPLFVSIGVIIVVLIAAGCQLVQSTNSVSSEDILAAGIYCHKFDAHITSIEIRDRNSIVHCSDGKGVVIKSDKFYSIINSEDDDDEEFPVEEGYLKLKGKGHVTGKTL